MTIESNRVNSRELWKQSIRLAFRSLKLIGFSFLIILSFLVMTGLLSTLVILAAGDIFWDTVWIYPIIVGVVICALCIFSLAMFFYGAMIGTVHEGLTQQRMSFGKGLRMAAQSAWPLTLWGIMFAVARFILRGNTGLVSLNLVVPVIILERKRAWPAVQHALKISSATFVNRNFNLNLIGIVVVAIVMLGIFGSMLYFGTYEDLTSPIYLLTVGGVLFLSFLFISFLLVVQSIYSVSFYLQAVKPLKEEPTPARVPTSTIPLQF